MGSLAAGAVMPGVEGRYGLLLSHPGPGRLCGLASGERTVQCPYDLLILQADDQDIPSPDLREECVVVNSRCTPLRSSRIGCWKLAEDAKEQQQQRGQQSSCDHCLFLF